LAATARRPRAQIAVAVAAAVVVGASAGIGVASAAVDNTNRSGDNIHRFDGGAAGDGPRTTPGG
jgi:hypothetical protein